jgi:hypothetical protein
MNYHHTGAGRLPIRRAMNLSDLEIKKLRRFYQNTFTKRAKRARV